MDGTPTARMSNEVTLDLMQGKLPAEPSEASSALPAPQGLPFEVDTKSQEYIDKALSEHNAAVSENQMHYLLYEKYGKDQIKAQKTGPDSW